MPENGRKNICRDKETTNHVLLMFLRLKCLRKGTNSIFELSQQRREVQCTVKNLKISSKTGQQFSEKENQSTNDNFRG